MKSLAEKTIEDVLLHFGKTAKVARRRYREFVKKGIAQGRRPEFQGGGLVRSAGGDKAGMLGRKKEEREKGDARILGSGGFVSSIIKDTNDSMNDKAMRRVSLDDLVSRVCSKYEVTLDELVSKRRKREISRARAVLCYLAVDELPAPCSAWPVEGLPCVMRRHFIKARLFHRGKATSLGGYSGDDVARRLRISGRGVSDCRDRGKKILDKPEIIGHNVPYYKRISDITS